MDSGLDHGLDSGLDFGLNSGLIFELWEGLLHGQSGSKKATHMQGLG